MSNEGLEFKNIFDEIDDANEESIAAVNFAINELKNTVPIWKKEIQKDVLNVFALN